MDTISRENNSMLPLGGIIVGVIGLLLGGFGLVQASKANKAIEAIQPKVEKIDGIESQVSAAATSSDKLGKDFKSLRDSTQDAFTQVGTALTNLQTSVTRLEEMAKKPAAAEKGGKKGGEAPVAGPGEYVIKSGDTFSKIAAANGTTASAIAAVNPGIESSKLKLGQKIKLPKK
jgi:LysM repeat protein